MGISMEVIRDLFVSEKEIIYEPLIRYKIVSFLPYFSFVAFKLLSFLRGVRYK
jgi:hypothetical protein